MAKTSVFVLAPDFPSLEGHEMLGGSFAKSLPAAKRLGYDGVEIIMGDPDVFDPVALQAFLKEYDLGISAINSGGIQYMFKSGLVSDDPQQRDFAFDKLQHTIRHCRDLGCLQQIGVARGPAVPGRSMRWFKDCLVDVLKAAAAYAAELGVEVVFEYTNRFEINSINTGVEACEIVDRVASPNVGMLVDTYHSYLEDPDVYQNILTLNGHVKHFHLHDSNGGAAIIGQGENDFDRIMRTCGQIGYHGWFSDGLHTLKYPEEEVRRSTLTLRELYKKYDV
jgi:sugar phosphate isomerase/epimerase